MSEFLSTEALSAFIDVPVGTLRQWRHRGEGPRGIRLGGHVRYRRSDVDAWLTEREGAERAPRTRAHST